DDWPMHLRGHKSYRFGYETREIRSSALCLTVERRPAAGQLQKARCGRFRGYRSVAVPRCAPIRRAPPRPLLYFFRRQGGIPQGPRFNAACLPRVLPPPCRRGAGHVLALALAAALYRLSRKTRSAARTDAGRQNRREELGGP